MYPTIATRIRSLVALYPLTVWLAASFLLLHTGLRGVLMAQTWHAAQMTLASAVSVFGTGLPFDLGRSHDGLLTHVSLAGGLRMR